MQLVGAIGTKARVFPANIKNAVDPQSWEKLAETWVWELVSG